ncbi:MAG: nuclear transport factor 2 family protein [Gammaproteobacteria bacterium]
MNTRQYLVAGLIGLMVSGSVAVANAADKLPAMKKLSVEARLQRMEDTEAIRELLIAYGRAFDKREFATYGSLFAKDGTWVGGADGATSYQGPAAIQAFVEKIYPATVNPGSFHIMSSMDIKVDGDTATSWSRWTYVVKGVHGEPAPLRAGHYEDSLVREDGQWKFKRRAVISDPNK